MKKRFKKVYIEITNQCNLSCNFCPKTTRPTKYISVEEFQHVLKQVKPFTDHIYLSLLGELLLHPKLKELLEEARKAELKVNVTTNGTLLQRQKEILLTASALRQINVSLHSFEANEAQMTLQEYVQSTLEFIKELSMKTKVIGAIRLWNMDSEELLGANQLNQDILHMMESYFPQEQPLAKLLMETKKIKLAQRVYLNMAEKFQWPEVSKREQKDPVFCYGLRDQIGILVEGTVVPCCLDSEGNIPLGNIYAEEFEEIIQSERAQNIYDGFSKRQAVEELCKNCHYAVQRFS